MVPQDLFCEVLQALTEARYGISLFVPTQPDACVSMSVFRWSRAFNLTSGLIQCVRLRKIKFFTHHFFIWSTTHQTFSKQFQGLVVQ